MNKRERSKEYEIDLIELIKAVFRKWWVVLAAVIAGMIVLFLYTRFFVTPLYKSSVSFYVNNGQRGDDKISTSDISASQSLVETYIVILKHGNTLDEVIRDTKIDYTLTQLAKKVSCAAINDTEVFQVTVTDPSPETATRIAKSIAKILPTKVSDVIDGSTVRIVRDADVPVNPSSPNLLINLLIGALAGILLSVIYLTLQFLLDDRIRDAARVLQSNYDYPVLAAIPDLLKESKGYYYSYGKEH